jgi:hypothetical protein
VHTCGVATGLVLPSAALLLERLMLVLADRLLDMPRVLEGSCCHVSSAAVEA